MESGIVSIMALTHDFETGTKILTPIHIFSPIVKYTSLGDGYLIYWFPDPPIKVE